MSWKYRSTPEPRKSRSTPIRPTFITTPYKTYDHHWVPISHTHTDVEKKNPVSMENFKKLHLDRELVDLVKKSEDDESETCELGENQTILIKTCKIDHVWVPISHTHADVEKKIPFLWKISKSCTWIGGLWTWWKSEDDESGGRGLSENQASKARFEIIWSTLPVRIWMKC